MDVRISLPNRLIFTWFLPSLSPAVFLVNICWLSHRKREREITASQRLIFFCKESSSFQSCACLKWKGSVQPPPILSCLWQQIYSFPIVAGPFCWNKLYEPNSEAEPVIWYFLFPPLLVHTLVGRRGGGGKDGDRGRGGLGKKTHTIPRSKQ